MQKDVKNLRDKEENHREGKRDLANYKDKVLDAIIQEETHKKIKFEEMLERENQEVQREIQEMMREIERVNQTREQQRRQYEEKIRSKQEIITSKRFRVFVNGIYNSF